MYPVFFTFGGVCAAYIDDVPAGIVATLERGTPGERYILDGENLTVKQLAQLIYKILGEKRNIIQLPNSVVRLATQIACTLHIALPYNPLIVPYTIQYWFMDSTKARKQLEISFRSAREALSVSLACL